MFKMKHLKNETVKKEKGLTPFLSFYISSLFNNFLGF